VRDIVDPAKISQLVFIPDAATCGIPVENAIFGGMVVRVEPFLNEIPPASIRMLEEIVRL